MAESYEQDKQSLQHRLDEATAAVTAAATAASAAARKLADADRALKKAETEAAPPSGMVQNLQHTLSRKVRTAQAEAQEDLKALRLEKHLLQASSDRAQADLETARREAVTLRKSMEDLKTSQREATEAKIRETGDERSLKLDKLDVQRADLSAAKVLADDAVGALSELKAAVKKSMPKRDQWGSEPVVLVAHSPRAQLEKLLKASGYFLGSDTSKQVLDTVTITALETGLARVRQEFAKLDAKASSGQVQECVKSCDRLTDWLWYAQRALDVKSRDILRQRENLLDAPHQLRVRQADPGIAGH